MVKNNDGKEMYASKEALSAAVKEACYGLEGLEIFWQDYLTFAQVAIVEGKGKTVMASSNIVKLLSIGGQFWNVRYTKKEGLVALFTFEKTPEAAQEAKAKLAEVEKVVADFKAKKKADKKAAAQAQLLTAMRAPLNAPVDDATQAGAEIASKAIGDKVQARIRAKEIREVV